MKSFTDSSRIILSRALTNSGDQAWDFAVPVSLALLFPGKLEMVALVFFLSRLSHILFLPFVGNLIDRLTRLENFRTGLVVQFFGVAMQAVALFFVREQAILPLCGIIVGGVLSGLGATMTSIGVAQDLVPSLFSGNALTKINSRIRQVDLFSEVLSPVVSGLLLTVRPDGFSFLGISLVALWNIMSFVPEYQLLRPVLQKSVLARKRASVEFVRTPIWEKLFGGWRELLKLPIAPAIFTYALLWLSALSPHGVLLTSFLKESWRMPEISLGIFRGLGAIFGLGATLIFPLLVTRFGVIRSCALSISFQSATLLMGLWAFHARHELVFLGAVLVSRIGLYAFSLGEQQIRQTGIPETSRGRVNATASALTGLATLLLLGAGSLLGSVDEFHRLIDLSVACVVIATVLFVWKMKREDVKGSQSV